MKTTRAGVGTSTKRVAFEAGRNAARDAVAELGGVAPGLLLVFGTTGYAQEELLRGVAEIAGQTPMVGCSVEGIITQRGADEGSHAVNVMAISSSRMTFHTFHVDGVA